VFHCYQCQTQVIVIFQQSTLYFSKVFLQLFCLIQLRLMPQLKRQLLLVDVHRLKEMFLIYSALKKKGKVDWAKVNSSIEYLKKEQIADHEQLSEFAKYIRSVIRSGISADINKELQGMLAIRQLQDRILLQIEKKRDREWRRF